MSQNQQTLQEQLEKKKQQLKSTLSKSKKSQELLDEIRELERQIDESPPPSSLIQPDPLRDAYLSWLLGDVCDVSLSGIDPKAATSKEAETCLNLGAIYTALLTFGADYDEQALDDGKKRVELLRHLERQRHQLSALAQLNTHAHLVLLGDPGSGKSTFVNFVTMCLAGEYIKDSVMNLALLTAPLPSEDGKDEEKLQAWGHKALLPVRIILRDFALEGLPEPGKPASVKHLWDFINARLQAATLDKFAPHLQHILRDQGGLLLLDGLDEVPEAHARRTQIKQVVEDFTHVYRHCRVLVTSRTYAYQKQDWRLDGFEETVLAPFTQGQIRRFVTRWYDHIAPLRGMRPDDAKGRADLLIRAILSNDRLYHLAERPLLLTLMASLHAWRGGSLPEKREELYHDTVELLLDWWEGHKAQNPEGQLLSLTELLKLGREGMNGLRHLMNELAYKAHITQPDLLGTANIPYDAMAGGLMKLSENREVNPRLLADYLRDRAGLLVAHGVDVYRFPHRTFQEYLAACYLTEQDDYPENIAELARSDPNRWREVVLLAGAKAARGAATTIWYLVDELCWQDVESLEVETADAWGALLAGQALLETITLTQISRKNRPKLERVRRWLVAIVTEQVEVEPGTPFPAVERALAGRLLAKLGDPRPGVGLREDGLPDIFWCKISAGNFLMGSDKTIDPSANDDEMPQHEVTVPAFKMSRYPITNAQYQAFMNDGGKEPRKFRDPFGFSNHPVVGVTWYDAVAFCDWLTEKLKEAGEIGEDEVIRLPSEAEWEYAARGPEDHLYPWGEEITPEHANYRDTNFGETSAVGCFPRGKSLSFDCEEMAGNVWEWCLDDYHENYEDAPQMGQPWIDKGKEKA